MSLGDALLTFVSVFVAALLAFYLDGLRERRATRAWVREYLGFRRATLAGDAELASGERRDARADRRGPRLLARWRRRARLAVRRRRQLQHLLRVHGRSCSAQRSGSCRPISCGACTRPTPALPAVRGTAEFVARLFEAEIRPLALGGSWPLDAPATPGRGAATGPSSRTCAISSAAMSTQLAVILDELVQSGF